MIRIIRSGYSDIAKMCSTFTLLSTERLASANSEERKSLCQSSSKSQKVLQYVMFWAGTIQQLTWACCVCVCAESCSSRSGTDSSLSDSVPDPTDANQRHVKLVTVYNAVGLTCALANWCQIICKTWGRNENVDDTRIEEQCLCEKENIIHYLKIWCT